MPRPYRREKIESVLYVELSKLLIREFDFHGALVTITSISVSSDLAEAVVKISVLPVEKELETYIVINDRVRALQHLLLKKMNIKPMPHVKFEISNAQKI